MNQEQNSAETIAPDRFEEGRPMMLGGLRRHHPFEGAEPGLAEQWRQFASDDDLPGRIGENRYGVMCGHDAAGFEYMCGVEVTSLADLPEGAGRMRTPPGLYAVFTHHGPAAALRTTWERIFAWLGTGSYRSAHIPDFEVYGPGVDPLVADHGIEIWVGVVPSGEPTQ